MIDRVSHFISRHQMFTHGHRIGVGVSGGADSVCLLHVLRKLHSPLTVIHINHLLRGAESDADENFVRELADNLGLPLICERIDVGAADSGNLEQFARDARRRIFLREIRSGHLDRVAVGHTRSDQAETVLFRFLRGSYTTGLGGMRPATTEGIIRPLLETDRSGIVEYLNRLGLKWREDSTNGDPRFSRNRIRHQLLPELTAEWNPNLPALLAQHATLAQEDDAYWEAEVDRLSPEFLQPFGQAFIGNVSQITPLAAALARRLIRRAFYLVKGDLRDIDFRHIQDVLTLLNLPSGHARVQVPGVDILRSFNQVRFAPPSIGPTERNCEAAFEIPGSAELPACGVSLSLELVDKQAGTGVVTGLMHATLKTDLDWNRIQSVAATDNSPRAGLFVLRNWRPGDAYRRMGDQHEHKIKTLFHEARIPLWDRRCWPVVTVAGRIVWSRDFGPASDVAADESSTVVLRISEKKQPS